MKRYIQYDPFNIYQFEVAEWPHPVHNHTYFEIIFIRSGTGKHFINENIFHYAPGDVFLLGPEDYHYFEIDTLTQFCYIRFTEMFIKDHASQKHESWERTIEFLLHTPYQSCGSIVKDEMEKELLNHLLAVLVHEEANRQEATHEVIMDSLMKSILSILARNIIKQGFAEGSNRKNSSSIEALMVYIRQHIYKPENLRIEHLATEFNFSQSYLSIFFKRHTGESLQQYILKYKLKLIENRLRYSNLSISQIAHEFGFTDESHLYKMFRKYYGVTPKHFRNTAQQEETPG
ncbi:helix-turn-helix transcriptional regulator [Adhaeribacter aquaticus]|uniref:helix-turn-helix transcriptional regulator n=1 Tax=Adhaeribacter aquaticus TaxID=299567 RepID=UPI0003FCF913|nr:AraC family transcriptional regulator [Adhaeribacter aquaticus]